MLALLKAGRPLGVGRLSITSWCIVISYRCCSEDRSEKLKLEQVFDRWMDKGGLVFLLKYFNWHISCSTADVKLGPIHWTISFSWLTWPREVEMLWSHQPMYLGIAPSTTRYINFLENEAWTIGHARPGEVFPSQRAWAATRWRKAWLRLHA